MIKKVKCYLGFHDYVDVPEEGIPGKKTVIYCLNCGKQDVLLSPWYWYDLMNKGD